MYSAIDVADYIIRYCNQKHDEIDNTRLQTFLFFVQSAYNQEGSVCFDEVLEAREDGPITPSVNGKYNDYSDSPIPVPDEAPVIADADQQMIRAVVDKYEWFSTDFLQLHAKTLMEAAAKDFTTTVCDFTGGSV